MTTLSAILLSLISFIFGMVASAYGSFVSQSIESRRDLLEKMRDWVDTNVAYLTALSEKATLSNSTWSDEALAALKRKSTTSSQRWLGVAKSMGSANLYNIVNEFVGTIIIFEARHLSLGETKQSTLLEEDSQLIKAFNEFESKARLLHEAITEETMRGFPSWLKPDGALEKFFQKSDE